MPKTTEELAEFEDRMFKLAEKFARYAERNADSPYHKEVSGAANAAANLFKTGLQARTQRMAEEDAANTHRLSGKGL